MIPRAPQPGRSGAPFAPSRSGALAKPDATERLIRARASGGAGTEMIDKRLWSGAIAVVTLIVAGAGALPELLLRPVPTAPTVVVAQSATTAEPIAKPEQTRRTTQSASVPANRADNIAPAEESIAAARRVAAPAPEPSVRSLRSPPRRLLHHLSRSRPCSPSALRRRASRTRSRRQILRPRQPSPRILIPVSRTAPNEPLSGQQSRSRLSGLPLIRSGSSWPGAPDPSNAAKTDAWAVGPHGLKSRRAYRNLHIGGQPRRGGGACAVWHTEAVRERPARNNRSRPRARARG